MLFRQFFDLASSTYTYLLARGEGHEALIIDPVKDQLETYLTVIEQLDLRLVRAFDTHTHADHITALGALRERTGCITMMARQTGADCVSERLEDGQLLNIDGVQLQALFTPGHTDDSMSFVLTPGTPRAVFSGDALLIRGSGRTDFQSGDAGQSWDSIDRLFTLPDETLVYPGHDYKGWTVSSIREEKRYNPRLAGRTRDEYVEIMNSLNLASPKMMDIAIPANLACGSVVTS